MITKIKVTFTTEDGELLDVMRVWDQARHRPDTPAESTPVALAQRVRDYIEHRFEFEDAL